MAKELLEGLGAGRNILESHVRSVRVSLHRLEGLAFVFLRQNGLNAEAGLAHEGVVETSMFAVATFVAQKSIELLIVEVATEATLKRVFAAVATDTVLVRDGPIAARTHHSLGQACSRCLVQRRKLDHKIGCDNGDRQHGTSLHLILAYFKHRKLFP